MEKVNATLIGLRDQEVALREGIDALQEVAAASSTPGIREFRLTRLRQLRLHHATLHARLRRLESHPDSAAEAYRLGADLRDAQIVAEGTFGR